MHVTIANNFSRNFLEIILLCHKRNDGFWDLYVLAVLTSLFYHACNKSSIW